MPADPAAVVRALRACRDAMIGLCGSVRIGGPVYVCSAAILAALDALADEISGQAGYFLAPGGGATEGERQALDIKMARERGDIPWKR
jgi:hypothetical protein